MKTKSLLEKRQWFLDAAVTTTIPLFSLLDIDGFYDDSELQNMPYHKFEEVEIIPIVTSLFTEGLIELVDYLWLEDLEEYSKIARPSQPTTPAEVEALIRVKALEDENIWEKSSYYALTAKGGAYWESLAHPDWNDFVISQGGVVEIPMRWTISGLSETIVREAIQIHKLNATPVEGSEQWSLVRPWQATYWKKFPKGHEVVYQCSSIIGDVLDFRKKTESHRYKVLYGRRWYQSPWHD